MNYKTLNIDLGSGKATPAKESVSGKKIQKQFKTTAPDREVVKFRLYIADHARNSCLARANLAAFCAQHLPGKHEIEVLDVFCEPQRACDDGIMMTPTLVKIAPLPVRKIVGTLRHSESVLVELGLTTVSE